MDDHRLRMAASRYIGGSNPRRRGRAPSATDCRGATGPSVKISRRLPWLSAAAQSRISARSLPALVPAGILVILALLAPILGHAATPAAAEAKDATASAADPRRRDASSSRSSRSAPARCPNARSSATLGQEREGTGVVIGDDGLILTVGYLIVEADEVSLVDQKGRTLPARVVAYDHATGLGLVRAIVPLAAPPLPLGESGKLADRDPVMIVNHAGATT